MKGQVFKDVLKSLDVNFTDLAAQMGRSGQWLYSKLQAKDLKTATIQEILKALEAIDPDKANDAQLEYAKLQAYATWEENMITGNVEPITGPGSIPYYDIDATASYVGSYNDEKEEVSYYMTLPQMSDCTCAMPVYGDSMAPQIKSGDTIVLKQMKNVEALLWGEIYLVVTNENSNGFRTVKRVYLSEDQTALVLRADNPLYKGDTRVPLTDVVSIYLVRGIISKIA